MRRRRSTRLNGTTAEELLDGHGPGMPLTWLLAAASAPGRAEEIAGEAAARAAFAGARTTQAPLLRPPQARRSLASRLIAAKAVALILLAAGATGGVALAANAQFAPAPGVVERSTTPLPPSTVSPPTTLLPRPSTAASAGPSSSTTPPRTSTAPRQAARKEVVPPPTRATTA